MAILKTQTEIILKTLKRFYLKYFSNLIPSNSAYLYFYVKTRKIHRKNLNPKFIPNPYIPRPQKIIKEIPFYRNTI